MDGSDPLVSIVIATYDRSNVLRLAIQSAIAQTFTDWELLVIGDACTDDSAEVVAAFDDQRISWHNLSENVGDQSGPNNEGVRRARGRYVAFLNHDDLWFPDHLETALAAIVSTTADLVFTLGAALSRSGRMLTTGVAPSGRYSLLSFAPASTWLMRRELAETVGPWLRPEASRAVPSQHWLALAHRAGKDLRQVPALTTILIASTAFDESYRTRRSVEQEEALARIRDDAEEYRNELLTRLLLEQAELDWPRSVSANARTGLKHLVHRTSARLGVHPHAAGAALRLQRRGAWLPRVYARRGIDRTGGVEAMIEGNKDAQSVDRYWDTVGQQPLEGVEVHDVRHVVKDNGRLTEIYRRDWGVGTGEIDQVFQVVLHPGEVSAWHTHRFTIDRLFVTSGTMKLALYDGRETSSTAGQLNVFRIGDLRPTLVVVPPGVWHGLKNIGDRAAAVLNLVDRAYDYEDPDHWRVPAATPDIPFSWD